MQVMEAIKKIEALDMRDLLGQCERFMEATGYSVEVADAIFARLDELLSDFDTTNDDAILSAAETFCEIRDCDVQELAHELADPDEHLEELTALGVNLLALLESYDFDDPRRWAMQQALVKTGEYPSLRPDEDAEEETIIDCNPEDFWG